MAIKGPMFLNILLYVQEKNNHWNKNMAKTINKYVIRE